MNSYLEIYLPIVFNILVLGEFAYSKFLNKKFYDSKDSWINIVLYWGNLLIHIPYIAFAFWIYTYLNGFAMFSINPNPIFWIALFFFDDFCFYWYHRCSHMVRLFWASHVNHHSSEHFNLTTALRQTWTPFLAVFFWAPLAWLGFPAWMILSMQAISLVYQSLLHTRTVPKLGPLEFVLNTPSNHRVHHGSNPEYLDKNFGGTLILWDHLFGTFKEEKEAIRFGITKPLLDTDPFAVAFHEYKSIGESLKNSRNVKEVLQILFGPPKSEKEKNIHKIETSFLLSYAFVFCLIWFVYSFFSKTVTYPLSILIGTIVVFILLLKGISFLFDQNKKKVSLFETIRFFLLYPEFRFSNFRTIPEGKKEFKMLFLGIFQFCLGTVCSLGLILAPLDWYLPDWTSGKHWILIGWETISFCLLFQGGNLILMGYYSSMGTQIRTSLPSPFLSNSILDFWRKFYPQFADWVEGIVNNSILRIFLGAVSALGFFEFVFWTVGVKFDPNFFLFFLIQIIVCIFQSYLDSKKGFFLYRFLSLFLLWFSLLVSVPFFFYSWNLLLLKM